MQNTNTSAPYFFDSEIPNAAPENAAFHVISIPLEATVSYSGGTALGPQAIIEASSQLELWNGKEEFAARVGIHTAQTVDCTQPLDTIFQTAQNLTQLALQNNAIPVILGGEHTVSYPPLKAIREFYGNDEPIGIIHFDAHCDLRDTYEESKWSHACIMRRAHEMGYKLFQVATRAYCKEEYDFRIAHNIPYLDGDDLTDENIKNIALPDDFPQKVYLSFDVDGLDATVMPATGTPVPGGLTYHQAIYILKKLTQNRTIIGMDIVELAPIENLHYADFTAANLTYRMMSLCQI